MVILTDLDGREYQHENDSSAMESLEKTPGLKKITNLIVENGYEKWLQVQLKGSFLLVTKSNIPELVNVLEQCCTTLGQEKIPPLYLHHSVGVEASVVGAEAPLICANSFAVDYLTDTELNFLIGRQIGHIKSGHCFFSMMASMDYC